MLNFKNLSKKEKYGILSVGIILFIVMAQKIIIEPVNSAFISADKKIIAAKEQLSRYQESMRQEDLIKKQYLQYKTALSNLGQAEENISFLLNKIETVARQVNVSLLEVKPQAVEKKDFFSVYSVEISLQAKITDIITFIHTLNADSALMRVEKIKMTAQDKSANIKSILLISIYSVS